MIKFSRSFQISRIFELISDLTIVSIIQNSRISTFLHSFLIIANPVVVVPGSIPKIIDIF
ncbi:TPA: hypothetical protein DEG21_02635 [Patescibacteria group bacterium]|nr:hypothetical protein [Candidatus Gracilibacteria bacterium]HBY74771.1 hypothetical protein [Candidatus Gracilibacteria bacterium]